MGRGSARPPLIGDVRMTHLNEKGVERLSGCRLSSAFCPIFWDPLEIFWIDFNSLARFILSIRFNLLFVHGDDVTPAVPFNHFMMEKAAMR